MNTLYLYIIMAALLVTCHKRPILISVSFPYIHMLIPPSILKCGAKIDNLRT